MRRFIPILILVFMLTRVEAVDIQVHHPITIENARQIVEVGEWQAESSFITQVEFDPTSQTFALVQNDQSLGYGSNTFLNLTSLQTIKVSKPVTDVLAFTFSPDGTLFAEVDAREQLNIYKTQDFELYSHIEVGLEPILNLAIDPNNHYVAVAIGAPEIVTTGKSVFELFDIEMGKAILSLDRATADIDEIFGTGTVFDNKGENVFLSSSDGIVRKWNLATQKQEIVGKEALRSSRILGSSANYQVIYLTQNGGIRLIGWDGKQHDIANMQHKEAKYFLASSIALHPTEPLLAVSYIMPSKRTDAPTMRDTLLQLWNTDSGEMLFETLVSEPGSNRIINLAFSPDGTLLASGGTDGTVRLWGVPG